MSYFDILSDVSWHKQDDKQMITKAQNSVNI